MAHQFTHYKGIPQAELPIFVIDRRSEDLRCAAICNLVTAKRMLIVLTSMQLYQDDPVGIFQVGEGVQSM